MNILQEKNDTQHTKEIIKPSQNSQAPLGSDKSIENCDRVKIKKKSKRKN